MSDPLAPTEAAPFDPDARHAAPPGAAGAGISALLCPALDPAFARPVHPGPDSAWYGHLPFAAWLVAALRPQLLVELGTRDGVSYAAFCEAVRSAGLPARCFAIDNRAGDEALDALRNFHDSRYGDFSRLLHLRFDEALRHFADNSIDLLHLDGQHPLADAGHLAAAWLPRLARHGIVLLHGTGLHDTDTGTRRLWDELRARHPCFEFVHGNGLGVLAPRGVPPALADLFALDRDEAGRARLRSRFARLGAHWEAEHRSLRDAEAHRNAVDAVARERDALDHRHDRLRDALAVAKTDRHRLHRQVEGAQEARIAAETAQEATAAALVAALHRVADAEAAAAAAARAASERMQDAALGAAAQAAQLLAQRDAALALASHHRDEIMALRGSTAWRLSAPLRGLFARRRGGSAGPAALPDPVPAVLPPVLPPVLPRPVPDTPPALPPVADPEPVAVPGRRGWRPIRRVLFVAGEPGTPGAVYRTDRAADACAAAGFETERVDLIGVNPDNLAAADLLVLWRAGWSDHLKTMVGLAHAAGTRVAFDVDDLITHPALAIPDLIDGIRTTLAGEADSRAHFHAVQLALGHSDLCLVTTDELAEAVRRQHAVVHVIPNGFDAATEAASRHALRVRGERAPQAGVRIGYAGGTRTHQKDFALAVPALVRVLEQRPEVVLVLFRDGRTGEGLVLVDEFPPLAAHRDRIEWRDMVPLDALPAELARFDISICPLQTGNAFCESKSELKYFESALAGVCLVASPTGPFRRAVVPDVTGLLAADDAGWEAALLRLVDDPALRHRLAREAYHHSLWQFGPRRQSELWAGLLAGLDGGAAGARADALRLARGPFGAAELPEVPDATVLFAHDALGQSRVCVGMTSYNYAHHLPATLDSVLAQTLELIDLVVVDDNSRDDSVAVLLDWAERHRLRFNRLRILRTNRNAGLGGARNVMMSESEAPWIMVLDSDNLLAPEACERLLAALDRAPLAAFAYPRLRQFSEDDGMRRPGALMGDAPFEPARLAIGNYIDAMAMVAKWAWAAAGGYYVRPDAMGWEDFSLWCRLVELGQFGIPVAEELAFYRVHAGSMVNAVTEQNRNKQRMVAFVEARHPWLRLRIREARKRL